VRHAIGNLGITTAQIGASGVLLIQYRLLKCGIESAPMTTDAGIDLVVYAPRLEKAVTVQVKACLKSKSAGGKGKLALDWRVPKNSPAEIVGLVNLADDQAWLFSHAEFLKWAQQTNTPTAHFYFYTQTDYRPHHANCHISDFEPFKIERRMADLFGLPA
jgi:hypothetical protein